MVTPQLLEYIKQSLQQGVDRNTIKNALLAQGWQDQDIETAFSTLSVSLAT